jgi:hypothetical protein
MAELSETIDWLNTLEPAMRWEFFNISLQYLRDDVQPKLFNAAGRKLGVEAETVQDAIESIAYFVTQVTGKQKMQFELPFMNELEEFCEENEDELKDIFKMSVRHNPEKTNYAGFDWRFELQVASRAAVELSEPRIILNFSAVEGGVKKSNVLESDYANLKHLYEELNNALQSLDNLKSKKAERFLTNAKNL